MISIIAIGSCKLFLDLWNDADAGIPEPEDARKSWARLKG